MIEFIIIALIPSYFLVSFLYYTFLLLNNKGRESSKNLSSQALLWFPVWLIFALQFIINKSSKVIHPKKDKE